jgi:hypothetical protein
LRESRGAGAASATDSSQSTIRVPEMLGTAQTFAATSAGAQMMEISAIVSIDQE